MWRIALTLLLSLIVIVGSALTAPVEAQPAYPTRPVETSWLTRPAALPTWPLGWLPPMRRRSGGSR